MGRTAPTFPYDRTLQAQTKAPEEQKRKPFQRKEVMTSMDHSGRGTAHFGCKIGNMHARMPLYPSDNEHLCNLHLHTT
jgi:hypothetical protein